MTETVTPLSETVSQIVRSRTCGCRDFYIAKITQNDATGYVAGTPVKLARAIKAKVDEKWTSEKIYSDDGTEEVINSYEGKVDVAHGFNKSLAGTYKVTASGLNLRAGAGTGKSILAVMKNGEKVQCYGYYNDCNGVKWLYVVYKNIVGYASSKYLSK